MIDSEPLKEEIKSLRTTLTGTHTLYEHMEVFKDSVLRIVDEQPTVEAVPVVHGKWLNFVGDYSMAECSKCGEIYEVSPDEIPCEKYLNTFKQFYKFCPNCGVRMDGDDYE